MDQKTIEELIRDTIRAVSPDPVPIEEQIRQRTERESNMIRVALGYVRAGDSKAAARILEAMGK